MEPSHWTTTYCNQYRDRSKYISPHPGQPQHHFKDQYDISHYQHTQGYYGTRASLAEHAARTAELQARSQSAPVPTQAWSSSTYSTSQPLPVHSSQVTQATLPRLVVNPVPSQYAINYAGTGRDLWNTPLKPLTGYYSDHSTMAGSYAYGSRGAYQVSGPIQLRPHTAGPTLSYWDPSYDSSRSTVLGVTIKGASDGPRNKYHIPGYQGFVRGQQFRHGDTYGKTTRVCLDVPTDVPLEP